MGQPKDLPLHGPVIQPRRLYCNVTFGLVVGEGVFDYCRCGYRVTIHVEDHVFFCGNSSLLPCECTHSDLSKCSGPLTADIGAMICDRDAFDGLVRMIIGDDYLVRLNALALQGSKNDG